MLTRELKREARKFQKWRAKKLAEERRDRGPDVYQALTDEPEPRNDIFTEGRLRRFVAYGLRPREDGIGRELHRRG